MTKLETAFHQAVSSNSRICTQTIPEKSTSSLASNALVYSLRSFLVLALGIARNAIVPMYLTVGDFGFWRLLVLYSAFAGLTHVGFVDGAYLRWLREPPADRKGNYLEHLLLLGFWQAFLAIIGLAVLAFMGPGLPFSFCFFLAIGTFTANLLSLTTFFLEVERQFMFLSGATVLNKLLNLVLILGLGVLGKLDFVSLMILLSTLDLLTVALLITVVRPSLGNMRLSPARIKKLVVVNIRTGIWLLLGNTLVIALFNMDRLLVSLSFPIVAFAVYGMATNIMDMFQLFLRSIRSVLVPYLAPVGNWRQELVLEKLRSVIFLAWAFALGGYFIADSVIQKFLPSYIASLPLIRLMLTYLGFMAVIFSVHDSRFKLRMRVGIQFGLEVFTLMFSAGSILLVLRINDSLLSVVSAQLATILCWYILNELSIEKRERSHYLRVLIDLAGSAAIAGAFWLAFVTAKNFWEGIALCYIGITIVLFTIWRTHAMTVLELTKALVWNGRGMSGAVEV